ncbi:DUF536 domain-containing protein, partial [Enterococcus faecium]
INDTGQKAINSLFFNENENSNQQLVGVKTKTETHKNAYLVPELEVLCLLEQQLNQKDMHVHEIDEQIKQMQKLLDHQ